MYNNNRKLHALFLVILAGLVIFGVSKVSNRNNIDPRNANSFDTFKQETPPLLQTYTDDKNGWQIEYGSPLVVGRGLGNLLEVSSLREAHNTTCDRSGGYVNTEDYPEGSSLEAVVRNILSKRVNYEILQQGRISLIQGREAYYVKSQIKYYDDSGPQMDYSHFLGYGVNTETFIKNNNTLITIFHTYQSQYGECTAMSKALESFKFIK